MMHVSAISNALKIEVCDKYQGEHEKYQGGFLVHRTGIQVIVNLRALHAVIFHGPSANQVRCLAP